MSVDISQENAQPLIYAFIGPSGTGKSHRASLVAVDKGVETIIDDGLLIHQGRILAGYSAKREATRMGAVRRAIMQDPQHAEEVRQALRALEPKAILILGTSRNMIFRIQDALGLSDAPIEWIFIEEIATEAERQLARRIRTEEGKHVIPAPTMEVQKSFSGYLVDPLRFIFRRKGRQVEVEKSIVRPTYSSLGRFYIADSALTSIIQLSLQPMPEIAKISRIVVQSASEGILVDLEVALRSRQQLFRILERAQQEVERQLEYMTSLNVLSVRITAKGISWQAEWSAPKSRIARMPT
ncbi:MAG: hypothetical protein OWQ57_06400 [Sulfobacillus sp.]|nr:hypothetical protein [Sulfobacillus sp.]